jgi:hypothetical protein
MQMGMPPSDSETISSTIAEASVDSMSRWSRYRADMKSVGPGPAGQGEAPAALPNLDNRLH